MGDLIRLAERGRDGASRFPPLRAQHEIDAEERAALRVSLVRKTRILLLLLSAGSVLLGWYWVAGWFFASYLFSMFSERKKK